MPISNYAELQSSVADWLNRGDLTARIPDFIALAEAKIRRKIRGRTIAEASLTAAAMITLPADCAAVRSLRLAAPQRVGMLGQVTIEEVFEMRNRYADTTGQPSVYAISDGTLYLAPRPDSAYPLRLSYYQTVAPLSNAAPSNALLVEHPDVYLYGTLLESAPFLEEPEKVALYEPLFEKAIFEANREYERKELSANLRQPRQGWVF